MTFLVPISPWDAGKTLPILALEFLFLCIITTGLDAQGSWGITAGGKKVAFPRGNKSPALADAIKHPIPKYPLAERKSQHQGGGVFRMIIDPKTGFATRVVVEKSTGFKSLDDAAVETFLQWRWKPGTWKEIVYPCGWHIGSWPSG